MTTPDIKKAARTHFYGTCLLGLLPLLGHLLIAGVESAGIVKVMQATPFADQNWLGHLIFFALAVGSGSLLNVTKVDKAWTGMLKMNFFHLIVLTILLWLGFGVLAVGAMPTPGIWIGGVVAIVVMTMVSYIVDMQIALLMH